MVLIQLSEDGRTPVDQRHPLVVSIENQVGGFDIPVYHRLTVGLRSLTKISQYIRKL